MLCSATQYDDDNDDGGDCVDDDLKMAVHFEEKSCWRSIDGESWCTLVSASATQCDDDGDDDDDNDDDDDEDGSGDSANGDVKMMVHDFTSK